MLHLCLMPMTKTSHCMKLVEIIHGKKSRFGNGYTVCSCFPLFLGKCSCHMQNWVFLCSLDNLLQKNVIVFFFGNQISKWRSFEKKGLFLTYFSHFLVTREKLQKFLQHISHSHTCILLTLLTSFFFFFFFFFALPILKKTKYEFIKHISLLYESWC